MRQLFKIVIVSLASVIMWSMCGCLTTSSKPHRKTIQGLFEHFKASGLKVDRVEDVVYQAVKASDGIFMYIDGQRVEIYDYNPEIPIQKERLDQVASTGKIKILTIPVPAIANGNLIMLTYSHNPKMREIIKAFKSF